MSGKWGQFSVFMLGVLGWNTTNCYFRKPGAAVGGRPCRFQLWNRVRLLFALILERERPGKLEWLCFSIHICIRNRENSASCLILCSSCSLITRPQLITTIFLFIHLPLQVEQIIYLTDRLFHPFLLALLFSFLCKNRSDFPSSSSCHNSVRNTVSD